MDESGRVKVASKKDGWAAELETPACWHGRPKQWRGLGPGNSDVSCAKINEYSTLGSEDPFLFL